MATPTLRPFRDYDEKDVINLFAFSGAVPTQKGTLVKIGNGGFTSSLDSVEMLGGMSDFMPSNVVAQRYGALPKVVPVAAGADPVIGMMLYDVRELDENGIPLKFNPRKAAEMEAVISGQVVPLVTRGIFAYSGIETGNGITGQISAGAALFASSNAVLTNQAVVTTITSGFSVPITGRPIATALGDTDAQGTTVILLHIK